MLGNGFTRISSIVALLVLCERLDRLDALDTEEVRNFLRTKRHLLFPDPKQSETKVQVLFGLGLPVDSQIPVIIGYTLRCNYNLPYNASNLPEEHLGRASEKSADSDTRAGLTSRWTLYRILESAMETIGSGKACLLLAVCESAANPFAEGHGLLGELLHVLLTPSTTLEEYEIYADREYSAAEVIGRNSRGTFCRSFYAECRRNPLDYFTVVRGL